MPLIWPIRREFGTNDCEMKDLDTNSPEIRDPWPRTGLQDKQVLPSTPRQGRQKSKIKDGGDYGTLYVVSTPIGNMEDITLRALRMLKSVNVIAAESVAHTKGLCEHYDIKTRLTSYHQHNQKAKAPELIKRLKAGHDVAIVTDAGTPGVSDPGVYLINRAAKKEISFLD